MKKIVCGLVAGLLVLVSGAMAADVPSFSIAVSEYPSWSGTFLTACDIGLIDGAKGKMGPLEKKWKVDLVVKDTDYDSCITLFVNGNVDAACLTNIDSLAPSVTRQSVAILPTSTSAGADACLVLPEIKTVKDLKGVPVRGLAASVSEYAFDKGLEALGENPKAYTFESLDPVQVGVVLQTGKIKAGVTWNPVVMETLKANPKIKRLFDSKLIKGHIIDMVTASSDSLNKPGGKAFGCAVVDTYYTVCKLMESDNGGVMKIEVPAGQFHITATWKDDNLWVENYDPATNTCIFSEYSKGNLLQGKVSIKNCNPILPNIGKP